MAHSLATVQHLSLSRSLSPKVHSCLKIVYMLKSELWPITKPLTTWEGRDESQPLRLAAARTARVYVCMYIMYTCRCVCMSVNYEEDILWYSTKLIHHNKRHKTRKQRTLSPFERESSYLKKNTGGIRFNMWHSQCLWLFCLRHCHIQKSIQTLGVTLFTLLVRHVTVIAKHY